MKDPAEEVDDVNHVDGKVFVKFRDGRVVVLSAQEILRFDEEEDTKRSAEVPLPLR